MGKIALAMFLLIFAGIGLAETPKIVNPPRPTKKFKWLIAIEHNLWNPSHTHYIFVNKYRIIRGDYDQATWIVAKGEYEAFTGTDRIDTSWIPIDEGELADHFVFLRAKAPSPEKPPVFPVVTVADHELKSIQSYANMIKKSHLKSQKAKVVFTK